MQVNIELTGGKPIGYRQSAAKELNSSNREQIQ